MVLNINEGDKVSMNKSDAQTLIFQTYARIRKKIVLLKIVLL